MSSWKATIEDTEKMLGEQNMFLSQVSVETNLKFSFFLDSDQGHTDPEGECISGFLWVRARSLLRWRADGGATWSGTPLSLF